MLLASLGAALQFRSVPRRLRIDHADTCDTPAPHVKQMQGNMPSYALRQTVVQEDLRQVSNMAHGSEPHLSWHSAGARAACRPHGPVCQACRLHGQVP